MGVIRLQDCGLYFSGTMGADAGSLRSASNKVKRATNVSINPAWQDEAVAVLGDGYNRHARTISDFAITFDLVVDTTSNSPDLAIFKAGTSFANADNDDCGSVLLDLVEFGDVVRSFLLDGVVNISSISGQGGGLATASVTINVALNGKGMTVS